MQKAEHSIHLHKKNKKMKAMETRGCLHVEGYMVVMQLFLSHARMTVLLILPNMFK